ncbi:MAG TPA: hypothetical protein ENH48_07105 [Halieaceae bacterium]|nr:hypothetical protein [Halieaceae bacterium]
MTASYAVSVRRVSVLPAASFRFHLAMDTLAVRLIVPLAGSIVDFHHQVIRPPPRVPEQRPSRRYAPCLAHNKEGAFNEGPFSVSVQQRRLASACLTSLR